MSSVSLDGSYTDGKNESLNGLEILKKVFVQNIFEMKMVPEKRFKVEGFLGSNFNHQ